MTSKNGLKRLARSENTALIIIAIALFAAFTIANPNFLNIDNITTIMNSMSFDGVLTVAMTVLLIGGEVDLSSGSIACFSGLILALAINKGMNWGLAIVLALAFGGCLGLINSFFVNKMGFLNFIATLGTMTIYQGFVDLITRNNTIKMLHEEIFVIGSTKVFGFIPLAFLIFIILLVVYSFILNRTNFGRNIYMCGGNLRATRLCGVNPKKISVLIYLNNGILCAVAGIVFAARMHSASPVAGSNGAVDAITAAVLGGVSFLGGSGNMGGCFLGVVIINVLNAGFNAVGFPSFLRIVARGALLIAALALDYYTTRARNRKLEQRVKSVNT